MYICYTCIKECTWHRTLQNHDQNMFWINSCYYLYRLYLAKDVCTEVRDEKRGVLWKQVDLKHFLQGDEAVLSVGLQVWFCQVCIWKYFNSPLMQEIHSVL